MKVFQIRIKGDTLRYVYDDALLPLTRQGQAVTQRASHVEPVDSGWIADLSPIKGPRLGPFTRRDQALEAEIAWIWEHGIPLPVLHGDIFPAL